MGEGQSYKFKMENTKFIVCCTVTPLKFESHMVQHVATKQICGCSMYNMACLCKIQSKTSRMKTKYLKT